MSDPTSSLHIATLLPGFAAGTLSPADHRTVLTHLAECSGCRAELAAWQAIGDATRAVYGAASGAMGDPLNAVWQRIDAERTVTLGTSGPAHRHSQTQHDAMPPLPPLVAPSAPVEHLGPGSRTPFPGGPHRTRRGALPVVTALLFCLILVAGVIRFELGGRDFAGRIALPAVSPLEGSPVSVDTRDGSVVKILLPEALLVRGDGLGFGLSHDVIPPASESTSRGGYLRIEHVFQGTVSVRSEGATQVVWAGGSGVAEPVPTGAEVTLDPGDTLIAPRAASTAYRNAAATPVDLVTWGMSVNPESSSNQTPLGWVSHDIDLRPDSSLPPGPVEWSLRRVELAAGAELAAPMGALHQFAVSVPPSGSGAGPAVTIGREEDDMFVNAGRNAATLYVVTLEPAAATTPTAQGGG